MSQNLDLVRSVYAAWQRGDFTSTQWADPAIEFVITDGPWPGRWIGLAEMTHATRDFFSAWDEMRYEVEYREIDHERVLALISHSGRGRTSGLDVTAVRAKGRTSPTYATAGSREPCSTSTASARLPTSASSDRRLAEGGYALNGSPKRSANANSSTGLRVKRCGHGSAR
jgi:ketosteroid isomerase-like protein